MKKLNIGVIDLVSKGPTKALYARVMHGNLAAIMPTVIATWCEQAGHQVHFICYTGFEDLQKELPGQVDLIFIGAFTQSAYLAYSLSNMFRSKGTITVLGGPHARCYPDDAIKYFDYVLGFTDKSIIEDILANMEPNPVEGKYLSANAQPTTLPGIIERWKFIEPSINKASLLKVVPIIGSFGCPYSCPFCIDSSIPYQMLDLGSLTEDIRFLKTKYKVPTLAWHDPNFGMRFNDFMGAIESTGSEGSLRFIAESSLSILNEKNLQRLKKNGFVALLPGVESWYELGNKSKSSHLTGREKLEKVSEHLNMVLKYIPFVQVNFVLGLDSDYGDEPFELTKQFIDKVPEVMPGFSLLTAFGEAAPMNLEYQMDDRIIPFPFHFMNNHLAMNVKPKNYSWIEFYDKIIDLTSYTVSNRAILNRFLKNKYLTVKVLNFIRAISSEGYGRIRFFKIVREHLKTDPSFRKFFEGESTVLPEFYINIIKRDMGYAWDWLPPGALHYDHKAYLKKSERKIKPVAEVNPS